MTEERRERWLSLTIIVLVGVLASVVVKAYL